MLPQPQVQRYSAESGLRDIMIAEKEVVLTFLLQLLSECGILDRLAFKGGTCLRKMFLGSHGRFSTDLDFTGIEEHDHEDIILEMMEAFAQPFHGIQFSLPDEGDYETQDGLSWASGVTSKAANEGHFKTGQRSSGNQDKICYTLRRLIPQTFSCWVGDIFEPRLLFWFTLFWTGAEDRATQGCDPSADSGPDHTVPGMSSRYPRFSFMGWRDAINPGSARAAPSQ
jgi:hypothetical protein